MVKAAKVNLTILLGAYAQNFSKDIDELYHYMDSDKNGTLDPTEAKCFMVELQKIATEDRKGNFKEDGFENVFKRFDDDNNGFLEKSELAVLIKHVFKTPAEVVARNAAMKKPSNKKSLKEILGNYADKFTKDLDVMYGEHDTDLNGMLDRVEMKTFLAELVRNMEEERAKNYDEANFDALFDTYDDDSNGYIEKSEMAVFIKKVFAKKAGVAVVEPVPAP